jgi:O-antigen ligase
MSDETFYLTIHTIRTRSQFRQLIYIIIGVAAFLSIFGLFKLSGANPFPWWNYTDIKTYGRFTATFGNSNHLAGYMEMAIPLLLGSLLTGFRASKITLMICLAFFMFLAIFFSLSRGGWIGLGIGLGFVTFALLLGRRHGKKYIFVTLICGFLVLAFVALSSTQVAERVRTFEQKGDISTVKSRMKRWPGTVEMIKDHPLSGTGPGTYATVFTQHHPPGYDNYHFYAHNDYLHFTAELGLFLIAVVVWMIIALYKKAFEKLKSPSRLVRGTTIGAMAGITAILVHSFGDFNLNIPANAILFTVLAALAAGPVPLDNVSHIRINKTQLITDNP